MAAPSTSEKDPDLPRRLMQWFTDHLVRMVLDHDEIVRQLKTTGTVTLNPKSYPNLDQVKKKARSHLKQGLSDRAFDKWVEKRCVDFYAPHYKELLADLKRQAPAMTRLAMRKWLDQWADRFNETCADGWHHFGNHFSLCAELTDVWPAKACPAYPKVEAALMQNGQAVTTEAVSLGGEPTWIQDPEVPICPGCDGDMALVMELKALPREVAERLETGGAYTFGDVGTVWLFGCQNCLKFETLWQCY